MVHQYGAGVDLDSIEPNDGGPDENGHEWRILVDAPPEADVEMVKLTGMAMLTREWLVEHASIACRLCLVEREDELSELPCPEQGTHPRTLQNLQVVTEEGDVLGPGSEAGDGAHGADDGPAQSGQA